MAGLLKFWEDAAASSFEYGKIDCVLWMADYIKAKTGADPAATVRGSYSSAFGCRKLVIEAGGLTSLVSRYMSDFERGNEVGVFLLDGVKTCGVRRGERVAFKTESGLMVRKSPEMLVGWDI